MSYRIFFLFAPVFKDWPFLISEEIEKIAGPVEIAGVVTGMEHTYRHVSRRAEAAGVQPMEHLASLELEWLSTPVEAVRLEEYEALLGTDAIQRLIICDRNLGSGFVSGGTTPRTPLSVLSSSAEMRRRYIVGLLDFLRSKLEKNRPDLVFAYAVAGAPAYALVLLCDFLGIPFLRLAHCRVGARHVIDASPLGLMPEIAETYKRSIQAPSVIAEFMDAAEESILQFRKRPVAPEYIGLFHEFQKRNLSARRLVRDVVSILKPVILPHTRPKTPSLRHPTHWQRARHRATVWFSARRILKGNTFCPQERLPRSRYVYYPLHFDPEASTMLFAPYHTDQISVIEALAKATPPSMSIVVKEHLPMVGLRPSGFYRRLKRIPGVVLASPFCDSFGLIGSADLTVTITGTAAWEALLLGRPSITIGQAPFNVVSSGISNCSDLSQLPQAVAKALQNPEVDDDAVIRYLAAILKHSFELPYELLWTSVTEARLAEHRPIATEIAQRIVAAIPLSRNSGSTHYGSLNG